MKKLFFILVTIYSFKSLSQVAMGFSKGDVFYTHQYRGFLTLKCFNVRSGEVTSEASYCRSEKLKPVDADYFIGPSGYQADRLFLNIIHSTGADRSRSEAYSSGLGRTVNKVNLGIPGLFQKPLLEKGENRIGITLFNKNTEVFKSLVSVKVNEGGVVRCLDGEYVEKTEAGCSPASIYCDRYFNDQKFCN